LGKIVLVPNISGISRKMNLKTCPTKKNCALI